MLHPKEELTVQIAQVDRVKVDDVNLPKAGEEEILQKFAANATRSDK